MALFECRDFWLEASGQQNIIMSSVSCWRPMDRFWSLVDLGDVHILWVSTIATGHQIAIVGPGQVWHMRSARMGVTFRFVPWVIVSREGNVRRIVELPCKPEPLLVGEVQPRIELFVQLAGHWRAPRLALCSWRWRWGWCWHCCLVCVARHCRTVCGSSCVAG